MNTSVPPPRSPRGAFAPATLVRALVWAPVVALMVSVALALYSSYLLDLEWPQLSIVSPLRYSWTFEQERALLWGRAEAALRAAWLLSFVPLVYSALLLRAESRRWAVLAALGAATFALPSLICGLHDRPLTWFL